MRLFVAVDPPAEAAARLDAALAAVRDGVPELRWGAPARWHLTLAFFGEVAEDRLPVLTSRLGRAASRFAPLSLAFVDAGTFPWEPARAQVLWVGVHGGPDGLARLAARCTAAARRSGVPVEDTTYRPHLTVARPRRSPLDTTRSGAALLSAYAGPPWTAKEVHLVRSHLGATVRHERLASRRLTGTTSSR